MRTLSEHDTPAKRLSDSGSAQELASLPPQGLFRDDCSDTHNCNGNATDKDRQRKRSAESLVEERAAKRAGSLEPASSRADSPVEQQRVVARQLFGSGATRDDLNAYFQQAEDKTRQVFKDRWNFDPTTEQPVSGPAAQWDWEPLGERAGVGEHTGQPRSPLPNTEKPIR